MLDVSENKIKSWWYRVLPPCLINIKVPQLHQNLKETLGAFKEITSSGLPTLYFKNVWKLREVLNVRVTAGHRPAQAQKEPAGWGRFSRFCLKSRNLFAK